MVFNPRNDDYMPTCVGGGVYDSPCNSELLVCTLIATGVTIFCFKVIAVSHNYRCPIYFRFLVLLK